jgi:hypothetical protein
MVEKETLRPLFKQILFDRQVRIVPNHGWSSMPHRHPVFNRLRLKQRQGCQVHVLYAGDFDPTGERMARNISLDLYLALVEGLRDQTLEQESKRLKKRGYEHVFQNYVSLAQNKYKLFESILMHSNSEGKTMANYFRLK